LYEIDDALTINDGTSISGSEKRNTEDNTSSSQQQNNVFMSGFSKNRLDKSSNIGSAAADAPLTNGF